MRSDLSPESTHKKDSKHVVVNMEFAKDESSILSTSIPA